MSKKRLCKICGMPLSQYNHAKVCFCHNEHPEKAYRKEIDHTPPIGAGHHNEGLNITILNQYGVYGFR